MTFKHKLSHRLALIRDIFLAATVALLACELPSRTSLNESIARVIVSPETLVVSSNQTTDVVAVALTAAGDTVTSGITWTASGGSVTDSTTAGGSVHRGRYRAPSSPGQYKVKAKANSGTAADSSTVTVTSVRVASVTLSPATAAIWIGAAQQFTAAALDSAGNPLAGRVITWSSNNPAVATVGISGLASGVSAGSAAISATSEGQTATATVTVTPVPVAAVTIAPSSATIIVGSTAQLSAVTKDAAGNTLTGRTVTWASSNTAVATVNGSGLVTGVATGSATITATSEGQSGSAAVSVTPVPVASVSVSPASANVTAGQTVQLTATPRDAGGNALSGRVVTWGSSNTAVATVNGSGLVTGVAAGSATITATSEGQSGSAAASVTQTPVPVASVNVSPASTSVTVGQTVQLTATPRDAGGNALTGRVVTWGSSNTAVATVNGSGLVTGVAAGSATITATSEGQSGSAAVSVTPVPVPVASVSVSPASANVTAGQTVQLTATPRDAGGNVLTGRVVTWGSSNTAVATVNGNGLVTGVAAGSATITATSEGRSGTATVSVAPVGDTTPPVLSNGQPTGTLASGTTQATMSVTTNEAATCKWGTSSSTSYASLANTFTTTGGTSHSTQLTGLSDGQSYTRYVRCQDGAGNANSSSYAVSFSVAAGGGSFAAPDIASADFQDGTFGPFTNGYGSEIVIMDDPTGTGFGKVARFHYHVSGPGNTDANTSLDYTYPAGQTDLYHRIYVYFVDPGTQGGVVVERIPSGLQRKLIYINAGEGPDYWTGTIQRWLDGATGTMDQGIYGPRSVTKSQQPQFSEIEVAGAIDVRLNTWYYFEYRVKLNTPGLSDGRIQIWGGIKGAAGLANALLYDLPNVDIRHGSTNGYLSVRFGQQLDAFTNGIYTVDDIRYIKNIAISTQRIGP